MLGLRAYVFTLRALDVSPGDFAGLLVVLGDLMLTALAAFPTP